ncbi:hypothetical protein [Aliivibrio fischeri]|uniref:hypothetical protein n=1 Tax=Aliivibrio fischeri TaxID=668 RepID=UPI0007C466C3|nr:hypothetical protein [Aliivibrio fischeri]
MKITFNPRGSSNTPNRIATVKTNEVLELLEYGTDLKLSARETAIALPILENIKLQGEEFTLRDIILKFKAVEELSDVASCCEKVFLNSTEI